MAEIPQMGEVFKLNFDKDRNAFGSNRAGGFEYVFQMLPRGEFLSFGKNVGNINLHLVEHTTHFVYSIEALIAFP